MRLSVELRGAVREVFSQSERRMQRHVGRTEQDVQRGGAREREVRGVLLRYDIHGI